MVALVLASAMVLTVAVVAIVRRPLPSYEGQVTLSGLSADVTVYRDELGVPQIYADDALDLFRTQGYLHAQDRFFQMDYGRHVTAGRLAELVGDDEDAIAADITVRTMGWRNVAEQEWGLLSPESRSFMQAYADGVNDYIASRTPAELSVLYSILDTTVDVRAIEPWSPVDSIAYFKAMAWDLRGNYEQELERAVLLGSVKDRDRVDQLFPAFDYTTKATIVTGTGTAAGGTGTSDDSNASTDGSGETGNGTSGTNGIGDGQEGEDPQADESSEPTASATDDALNTDAASAFDSEDAQSALVNASDSVASVPHLLGEGEGIGSNSWVVSGEHTSTGEPLLANDPHLSTSAPGVWTQNGLHCRDSASRDCQFDVSGFSFAGVPGVIIGHNADLSWGLTNLGADVTDFFLERVDGSTYVYDGESLPISQRHETIRVNGAPARLITIRETQHGPIISDASEDVSDAGKMPLGKEGELTRASGYAVALKWTALSPGSTAEAVFGINRASTAADITAAAAKFDVPSQNIVFATTDGHIGYQAPGRIPIRRATLEAEYPADGSWPRPGWSSYYDWAGYVNAERMPSVLDPEEGFIVAANQAVTTPGGGDPFFTVDWDHGYRSQRIRALIEERIRSQEKIDIAFMEQTQHDDDNPYWSVLKPYVLNSELEDMDAFTNEAVDLLRDWDGSQEKDSPAAAYFAAVWANLLRLLFHDEGTERFYPDGGSRWLAVVTQLLANPTDRWWDNTATSGVVENRDAILNQALSDARLELTTKLGKEPPEWRWGQIHTLTLEAPALGGENIPAAVRALVNPATIELDGGSSIVNAMSWNAQDYGNYRVTAAPSMRMVVDLDNLDNSRWVNQTGSSGHPASEHYTDQIETWANGGSFAWRFTETKNKAEAASTVVFKAR